MLQRGGKKQVTRVTLRYHIWANSPEEPETVQISKWKFQRAPSTRNEELCLELWPGSSKQRCLSTREHKQNCFKKKKKLKCNLRLKWAWWLISIQENRKPYPFYSATFTRKLIIRLLRCTCGCSRSQNSQQGLFLHKGSPQNPLQVRRQSDCKAHSFHQPYKFAPLKLGLCRATRFGNTSKNSWRPAGSQLALPLLEVEPGLMLQVKIWNKFGQTYQNFTVLQQGWIWSSVLTL